MREHQGSSTSGDDLPVPVRTVLGKAQKRILKKAIKRHQRIHPCGDRQTFSQCFTECNGKTVLWFDTDDRSTHAVVE